MPFAHLATGRIQPRCGPHSDRQLARRGVRLADGGASCDEGWPSTGAGGVRQRQVHRADPDADAPPFGPDQAADDGQDVCGVGRDALDLVPGRPLEGVCPGWAKAGEQREHFGDAVGLAAAAHLIGGDHIHGSSFIRQSEG